jgi:hypothetical protein
MGLSGPYDRDPDQSEALWFLPDPVKPSDNFAPLPRADRHQFLNPAEWRIAQGSLAVELAQVALRMGLLAVRLAGAGEGLRQRLALQEAADLSWWVGDRIGVDRLALWLGLREGAAADDTPALARAAWAVRRLGNGTAPGERGWDAGLAAFLGRNEKGSIADLAGVMEDLIDLHPVVQAAVLFQIWRLLVEGQVGDLEAAVIAARHGATMMPGAETSLFMPIAMGGYAALAAQGSPERRLAGWLTGIDLSLRAALALLDRVERWEARAGRVLSDLQGRTMGRLVVCLARWPMVTAPQAEAETGASRAAVQRNLDLLLARGLVREVTGQGRYRVWAARV